MVARTDIKFVDHLSPRLITVDKTSSSIVIQDLHDSATKWESELYLGMDHDKLIDSAGKEDLGGGVLVGITSELQDAQLEFEPRTTPISSGSATASGTTILSDSSATFITNGVSRGDLIINFTDFCMASVLSVDSETQITHRTFNGGIGNNWDISDTYRIYNIEQVEIAGGNLVSVNNIGDPIPAILPSFGTQIVRTSSSSSTITEIENNTYLSAGGIHVDINNGFSGTSFPTGTPTRKSNNLTDAFVIATKFGITTFIIYSDVTLPDDCIDWVFIGNVRDPIINFNGKNVDGCLFKGVTISGTMLGSVTASNVVIKNVTGLDGFFKRCGLEGTNIIASGSTIILNNCYSRTPGIISPIMDMNAGLNGDANITNFSGRIEIRNMDQINQKITLTLSSGQVIVDSSCTDGIILIDGVGKLTDNSLGTNIVVDGMITGQEIDTINNNTKLIPSLI